MGAHQADLEAEAGYRAILGLMVLLFGIALANVGSLPVDTAPFAARMQDGMVWSLFAAGFTLHVGAATWLGLALLLDARRSIRPALALWLAALCLVLAPVPTVRENVGAALVPLLAVVLVALLGWAVDDSLREQAA